MTNTQPKTTRARGRAPRRVLVTGGAGFIGARLVTALVAAGDVVTAVDNFHRGRRAALAALRGHPRCRLLPGDVADPACAAAIRRLRPQVVYHLAAIHYIPECLADPAQTARVNVLGTQRVLDAIPSRALERAILISSGAVYAPQTRPVTEQDRVAPLEIYGTSKWVGELLWQTVARETPRAAWLVARLFNTYGPGETNPHLLPHLVAALRRGRTVRLGELAACRDFIYIEDTVEALLAVGRLDRRFAVFNVGSGKAASVAAVLRLLERLLGAPITVIQEAGRRRPLDRRYLCADITKLRRATGWCPRWALRDGLRVWLEEEGVLPVRRGPCDADE